MFENIKADMARYDDYGGWKTHAGFWITAIYRFGRYARTIENKPLSLACRVLHQTIAMPVRVASDVYLPTRAEIGPGLRIVHPHSIYLIDGNKLGENCTLYHEVTLGKGHGTGVPVLGNNVQVSPGVKIIGGVTLGDGVTVGPNAVVTKNIKADAIVFSSPPGVIPGKTANMMKRSSRPPEELSKNNAAPPKAADKPDETKTGPVA